MTVTTNLATQRSDPSSSTIRLISSFQRPANVTAYSAGDAVLDNTSARVIGFTGAPPSGQIVGASLIMGDTETTSFDLVVFDQEPTNFADNAAFALAAADLPKVCAMFDFEQANKSNLGTNKEYYRASSPALHFSFVSDGGALYAHLIVRTGFTPASAGTFALNLHVVGNRGD